MQEHKFRAWDSRNNCWFSKPVLISQSGKVYDEFHHVIGDWLKIEWYTSLKDKSGIEIYKGDIVCDGNVDNSGIAFVVEFGKLEFRIHQQGADDINEVTGWVLRWKDLITPLTTENWKVIGNIHDGILTKQENLDIVESYGLQNDKSPQKGDKQSPTRTPHKRKDETENRNSEPKKN